MGEAVGAAERDMAVAYQEKNWILHSTALRALRVQTLSRHHLVFHG
jgi:hypothetical protein